MIGSSKTFSIGLLAGALAVISFAAKAATPPASLSPLPTARQLAWQDGGDALMVNFGINTFSGDEGGTGK